ncbi:hypothetical protein [Methylomonas rapida]|uniref:Uncharacterized protein n=1 Tax=Methylomonas rapida TaxID=2963939 RepID=A0ABY7GIW3_9GAMM|nr:hypothetical protein [Methylomonas rapida]WAR43878.1 hypothetical protein NM686_016085 [Methylomonas rapida]
MVAIPPKTINQKIKAREALSFADIIYCYPQIRNNKAEQRRLIAQMTREYLAGELRAKDDGSEFQHWVKVKRDIEFENEEQARLAGFDTVSPHPWRYEQKQYKDKVVVKAGIDAVLSSEQHIRLSIAGRFEVIQSPYLPNFTVSPADYAAYLGNHDVGSILLNEWLDRTLTGKAAPATQDEKKKYIAPIISVEQDAPNTDKEIKFNRLLDEYLFELWCDCGKPEKPSKFKKHINTLKNHQKNSLIGNCYGSGNKGEDQWTFEFVKNGIVKSVPSGTLGNKVREFKKRVNPQK